MKLKQRLDSASPILSASEIELIKTILRKSIMNTGDFADSFQDHPSHRPYRGYYLVEFMDRIAHYSDQETLRELHDHRVIYHLNLKS